MKIQELIERQAALVAELEAIEQQMCHDAREPLGMIAIADEHGVDFHEKSLPWDEIPALIAWLQSLVGEVEPKSSLVWKVADFEKSIATASDIMNLITGNVDGRPVEKGEVRFHGETPATAPKPWPIWCANRVSVWQHANIETLTVWSFRAPNKACAERFAAMLRADAEHAMSAFTAHVAEWYRNGEEVQA
jgi:hypothetical protein